MSVYVKSFPRVSHKTGLDTCLMFIHPTRFKLDICLCITVYIEIHMELDRLDLKILSILLREGRISSRELSRRLGVSVGTVEARRKRLEDMGVIRRYTVDIDLERLGYIFPVMIDVKVRGGFLREVEERLASMPNVQAVYDITGEYDITLYAWFRTRSELDSFIKEVQRIEYVDRTHTRLILNIVSEGVKEGYVESLLEGLSTS